jgi:hypothetical protein
MILTDAEYAAFMSIPDVTDKVDKMWLYESGADQFLNELYRGGGRETWKCALSHAAYLNEKHYEDHLSFRVVKYCQDYYVLDKVIAEKKLGLDLSAPLPII